MPVSKILAVCRADTVRQTADSPVRTNRCAAGCPDRLRSGAFAETTINHCTLRPHTFARPTHPSDYLAQNDAEREDIAALIVPLALQTLGTHPIWRANRVQSCFAAKIDMVSISVANRGDFIQ